LPRYILWWPQVNIIRTREVDVWRMI